MKDPKYPTAPVTELFDPHNKPPPKGQMLILINEGGRLIVGNWYEGALAWGHYPKIPASVKARQNTRMKELLCK